VASPPAGGGIKELCKARTFFSHLSEADFLLEGRRIRGDVHEWLAARLPKHSRLH
jgi:hypothetical protein